MPDESMETAGREPEATPNRDRRRAPPVIEGEAVRSPGEFAAHSGDGGRESSSDAAQPSSGAARIALSAAVGALVGAAVAAGGMWVLDQRYADAYAARLDGLDKAVAQDDAGLAKLAHRVEALAAAASRAPDKSAADANHDLLSEAQAARADAAKALSLATNASEAVKSGGDADLASKVNALAARADKLEAALASNRVDLGPLNQRIDKIESGLAAAQSASHASADSTALRRDGTDLAVVAQALAEHLRAGEPFAAEEAALERLGADPARLAILKPLAGKGVPTASALAARFADVAPAARAAASKKPEGAFDRLLADMGGMVKVTRVGEVAGDDPSALISQIGAALDRGRIGPALAAWRRLPEAPRAALQPWADMAKSRLAADEATQGIIDVAIGRLSAASH
jgi:hypothetical protein